MSVKDKTLVLGTVFSVNFMIIVVLQQNVDTFGLFASIPSIYPSDYTQVVSRPIFVILRLNDIEIRLIQWYVMLLLILEAMLLNIVATSKPSWRHEKENKNELYPDTNAFDRNRKMAPIMRYRITMLIFVFFLQYLVVDFKGPGRLPGFLFISTQLIMVPLALLLLMFLRSKRWLLVLVPILLYSLSVIYLVV